MCNCLSKGLVVVVFALHKVDVCVVFVRSWLSRDGLPCKGVGACFGDLCSADAVAELLSERAVDEVLVDDWGRWWKYVERWPV